MIKIFIIKFIKRFAKHSLYIKQKQYYCEVIAEAHQAFKLIKNHKEMASSSNDDFISLIKGAKQLNDVNEFGKEF